MGESDRVGDAGRAEVRRCGERRARDVALERHDERFVISGRGHHQAARLEDEVCVRPAIRDRRVERIRGGDDEDVVRIAIARRGAFAVDRDDHHLVVTLDVNRAMKHFRRVRIRACEPRDKAQQH